MKRGTAIPDWTIETFENDRVKVSLSLISNEHFFQNGHRDKCKTIFNVNVSYFTTQDYSKGDEWQENWYDEDFTTFGSAYATFEIMQKIS